MARNLLSQFAIAFLIFTTIGVQAESNSPFRLFVIHSYEAGMWTHESSQGIRNLFSDRNILISIHDRIFDYYSYLSKSPIEIESQAKLIEAEIKTFKPHIIFIFDDEAADVLTLRLNALGIPLVLSGINKSKDQVKWWKEDGNLLRNFTGTWERYPFSQSLRMLHRINPAVTKIALLTGSNESAVIITNQLHSFFKQNGNRHSDIQLEKTFMSSRWNDWKKAIETYKGPNRAFWIVSPWNVYDEANQEVPLKKISEFYHSHSKLPTLAIASVNQQLGFLASFAVSPEDLGYQAGEQAFKILVKKVAPKDITFEENKMIRFVINKDRATKLGYTIPLDLLEFAKIEKKIPMKYVR